MSTPSGRRRARRSSTRPRRSARAAALAAAEAERRHVARELHDEIGGALSALQATLAIVRDGASDAGARRRLDDGLAVIARVLGGVRRLARALHPPALDDLGLAAALRSHAAAQAERGGLDLALDVTADAVPAALALPCFRIAQEAIANVLRHARARRLVVTLRLDSRGLALAVEDDGAGFDRRRARGGDGLGLSGMAERAALAGGRLEVRSAPGRGTRVHAVLPLPGHGPSAGGTRSSSRRRDGRTRRRSP